MTNVRCRAMGVLAAMAILLASCSSSPPTSAPSSSPATPATSARSSTAAPAATAPTFPPSQTAIEPGRYRWDGFESPVSLEVGAGPWSSRADASHFDGTRCATHASSAGHREAQSAVTMS